MIPPLFDDDAPFWWPWEQPSARDREGYALRRGIGVVVRHTRQCRHMNRLALATRLHTSPSFVTRLERAQRELTVTAFLSTCRALDVEPAAMMAAAQEEAFPLGWHGDRVMDDPTGQLVLPFPMTLGEESCPVVP